MSDGNDKLSRLALLVLAGKLSRYDYYRAWDAWVTEREAEITQPMMSCGHIGLRAWDGSDLDGPPPDRFYCRHGCINTVASTEVSFSRGADSPSERGRQ